MSRKIARLKPKKTKGRIKTLKALPYKKVMVYLRRIDEDIFEYIIPYKGQIFSSYLIIEPEDGKRKLTKDEVVQSAGLIFSSAVTTVDFLLGNKKEKKKIKKAIKSFEKSGETLPN